MRGMALQALPPHPPQAPERPARVLAVRGMALQALPPHPPQAPERPARVLAARDTALQALRMMRRGRLQGDAALTTRALQSGVLDMHLLGARAHTSSLMIRLHLGALCSLASPNGWTVSSSRYLWSDLHSEVWKHTRLSLGFR